MPPLLAIALALATAFEQEPVPPPPPPPPPVPVAPAPESLRPPLAQPLSQEPRPPVWGPGFDGGAGLRGEASGARFSRGVAASKPKLQALSVFDAATLDDQQIAVAVALGFPYAMIRGAYGLSESIDVGAGFNSLYGQVNQPVVFGKLRLRGDTKSSFAFALRLDLEAAFFRDSPSADGNRGARWLTGQRDFSVHPGLLISTRSNRGAVFFADIGAQVTFDTHPRTSGPLTGRPPPLRVRGNLPLRMGVDLPLSAHLSFFSGFGLDVHFHEQDSAAMPYLELGVTFGG